MINLTEEWQVKQKVKTDGQKVLFSGPSDIIGNLVIPQWWFM